MKAGVQKSTTAAAALLTAGAVAVAPLTVPDPAASLPGQTVEYRLSATTNPAEAAAILAEGFLSSLDRLVDQLAAIPPTLIVGGYDLGVQDTSGLYASARSYVGAPVVIVTPIFEALATILPAPLGGTDGNPWSNTPADGRIIDFVDHVLWPAVDAVNAQIAKGLHVDPATGSPLPDPAQVGPPETLLQGAATLAVGFGGTAVRIIQAVALTPLTTAQLAVGVFGALTTGDNQYLYQTVRDIIDGPLWAADPAIDALAKVLPAPWGGTDGVHGVSSETDGQIIKFRDRVLWGATNAVRNRVAEALGVEPVRGEPLPSVETTVTTTVTTTGADATLRATANTNPAPETDTAPPSPAKATGTATTKTTASDRNAVRNRIQTSTAKRGTAVETFSGRLGERTKKTASHRDSTTNPKKVSSDRADKKSTRTAKKSTKSGD